MRVKVRVKVRGRARVEVSVRVRVRVRVERVRVGDLVHGGVEQLAGREAREAARPDRLRLLRVLVHRQRACEDVIVLAHLAHVVGRAKDDGHALVDILRDQVHDARLAGRGEPTRLLDEGRHP